MTTANVIAALGIIALAFGLATIASTIAGAYALSQVTFQNEAQWDGTVTIDVIRFDLQRYDLGRILAGGLLVGLTATTIGGVGLWLGNRTR